MNKSAKKQKLATKPTTPAPQTLAALAAEVIADAIRDFTPAVAGWLNPSYAGAPMESLLENQREWNRENARAAVLAGGKGLAEMLTDLGERDTATMVRAMVHNAEDADTDAARPTWRTLRPRLEQLAYEYRHGYAKEPAAPAGMARQQVEAETATHAAQQSTRTPRRQPALHPTDHLILDELGKHSVAQSITDLETALTRYRDTHSVSDRTIRTRLAYLKQVHYISYIGGKGSRISITNKGHKALSAPE